MNSYYPELRLEHLEEQCNELNNKIERLKSLLEEYEDFLKESTIEGREEKIKQIQRLCQ